MENSRTRNVMRNISWAIPLHIILMLLQFVARTVFVRQLGKEYLGINGLFADIIWILDLANLRLPEAIIICMYKPLSEKKYDKVRSLIYLFGKAYSIIGLVVLALGLLFIPLLPVFIKEPPKIPENFTIIYLFFLFQAVVTYYIVYKRSIIFADQKDYIVNIYQKVFQFIQIIIQIIILMTIRNFYIFLAAQVFCVLLMNFLSSRKAEKMYPFIKEKNNYKLSKDEISEVFSNVKSMFIYGIGAATLIGIDSILISSIVGIGVLGLCSNYMLIVSSVRTLIDKAMDGFTASIGNLNVNEDMETTRETFDQVFFIVFFINAFLSINLAASLNSLITVWLGNNFLLSQSIVISILLRFYVQSTQYVTFTFRSTLGLLKKFRYIPIITALVNISLSIIMGRIFGVSGIFHASSIAVFFFTIIPEAYLLYKYIYKRNLFIFILRYIGYILFMTINYAITSKILIMLAFKGWKGFVLNALTGAVISGILFLAVFFRDRNFKAVLDRLIYIVKSRN